MQHFISDVNSLSKLASEYEKAKPFPHVVLSDLWDESLLNSARTEVESFTNWNGEKNFFGSQKKRFQNNYGDLPFHVKSIFDTMHSPTFLEFLEGVTGEVGLIPDPYLLGGGIHSTASLGFLKLHADFNWHEKLRLYRRLNVLIYLNKDWIDSYNGELELAHKQDNGEFKILKTVKPIFNTTVIFTTDDDSYHGQSEPLNTPSHVRRNSLAAYFYVSQKPDGTADRLRANTDYRHLSGEAMKKESAFERIVEKIRKKLG